MTEAADICEELNGVVCVEAPLEVSEALPLDWDPVCLGVAFSIEYVGLDGILYRHEFNQSGAAELLADIDQDNIDSTTAQALSETSSLLLVDPEDDFLVINKVELTSLGLKG